MKEFQVPNHANISNIFLNFLDIPYIKEWVFGVPITYFILVLIFRSLNWWPQQIRSMSKGSDIMAFEITAFICVTYISLAGVIGQLELFGVRPFPSYENLYNMVYVRSDYIEGHLLSPMVAYQFWNLMLSLYNRDLGSLEMIFHHLFATLSAIIAAYPYNQYYALYFYGVCELTNIPLTIVDIFKLFPQYKEKYENINVYSRYLFAVSFFTLRLFIWPFQSYSIWKVSFILLEKGEAHSNAIVLFILFTSIILTFLQYSWGYKIISFVLRTGKDKQNDHGY